MRISTKKILITILMAALSSILLFAVSCSSTENPEEKNYNGFPPKSGEYLETYSGSTNKATVTIIYNSDGSETTVIKGTARNQLIQTTNETNINFEIQVGGWHNGGRDIFKYGYATNITIISPNNINMLSADAWWNYVDTSYYELGVYLQNNISGEGEVKYAFSGTN